MSSETLVENARIAGEINRDESMPLLEQIRELGE